MKQLKHKFEAQGILVEISLSGNVEKEVMTIYRLLVRAVNGFMKEILDRVAFEKMNSRVLLKGRTHNDGERHQT